MKTAPEQLLFRLCFGSIAVKGMAILMKEYMQPVKLTPAFKDFLWGGTRLKEAYNKKSDLDIVAESWELSTHSQGQSTVACGPFADLTLTELIEKNRAEILGTKAAAFAYFPLLIKFIDAHDNLSVQVHPDDAFGMEHEGEYGKTEMWYILECEEGAGLYYGVNRELTREEFAQRIEDNTVLEVLNRVEVHKGDVFFIPAGTIHAIGKGIVICEIQQNSATTYRVYDYDRRDAQGNTRPLHIEKALQVSRLTPSDKNEGAGETEHISGGTKRLLSSCEYFTVYHMKADSCMEITITKDTFQSVVVTEGTGTLKMVETELALQKGDSIFIPAQDGIYTVTGNCEFILSHV